MVSDGSGRLTANCGSGTLPRSKAAGRFPTNMRRQSGCGRQWAVKLIHHLRTAFMKRKKTTALTVAAFCLALMHMAGNAASAQPFDIKVIAGEWARIDGSYTLRVDNVQPDGTADVKYFNPGSIHVAENRIDTKDGRIRLFVKLQDKGYPGSTYTLYYYFEKDVLVGTYHQAATGRTYDVVFVRKNVTK